MILKAGDIRQEGDEHRRLPGDIKGPGSYGSVFMREYGQEFEWSPVPLIGHMILQSDLIIAEFRRGK